MHTSGVLVFSSSLLMLYFMQERDFEERIKFQSFMQQILVYTSVVTLLIITVTVLATLLMHCYISVQRHTN